MSSRLTRVEQSQRNRKLVLFGRAAAVPRSRLPRSVVGAIADAAGFSKGVVYSQFESKADLFLALLEQRIDERKGENTRFVERLVQRDG